MVPGTRWHGSYPLTALLGTHMRLYHSINQHTHVTVSSWCSCHMTKVITNQCCAIRIILMASGCCSWWSSVVVEELNICTAIRCSSAKAYNQRSLIISRQKQTSSSSQFNQFHRFYPKSLLIWFLGKLKINLNKEINFQYCEKPSKNVMQ